ncbi:dTDP-4-dehydrorhamnose reductase [Roseomonas sp. BN140053]|uniref:dTDP-4-dehydrorhamnose reductase n=1 Tax=Roseomonas sp. BN140053 TaxID=3391898 RepID=UPI0039ED7377
MTRVLVVGREGQVARALLRRLPRDGHAVVALEPPELDLTRPDTIAAALREHRPALVVNAAAYTAVDRAEEQPDLADAVNNLGVGALAAAAAATGAPMVHFSTDYVFDGLGGAPYAEDAATNPLGVYGVTKLAGERAALAAQPRSAILRTAWVCSPDGGNFVKTMLRLAAERDELRVVADQRGAPTFADDLAEAVAAMLPRLLAAPAGDEAFGVFHLTGAPHATWHGFATAIVAGATARGHGRNPRVTAITTAEFPTRARRPADGRLDCGRIGRVHGIRPADWRVSLDRCLDALLMPPTGGAQGETT